MATIYPFKKDQPYQIKITANAVTLIPTEAKQLKMSKDGTNYEIIAYKLPFGINAGYMCNDEPVWLIISCYDKTAYSFAERYQSWDYIAEKLCPKGSRRDAQNLKILIDKAINQTP